MCSKLKNKRRIQNKKNIFDKCNFYNVGYYKYSENGCRFKDREEQCSDGKCCYKTCQKRHQRECKWFLSKKGCRHGNKCGFKHNFQKANNDEDDIEEEIKTLKSVILLKVESIQKLTNSIATLDQQFNDCKKKLEASEVRRCLKPKN